MNFYNHTSENLFLVPVHSSTSPVFIWGKKKLLFFFFFFQQQLLSFISSPYKGQFKFRSIPFLSPSPPSDQILQAPDPGWQEQQQLLVSVRSALNPPEECSTTQTTRQLHPKLGAAQRQASR